jgi:hypothetical protein
MNWLPQSDGGFDVFYLNYKTLIVANPTSYALQAADGTALNADYTTWHAAYLAATNPTTRTTATVATKNTQKGVSMSLVRGYAAQIRANRAISEALKIGLGLHIPDTSPTNIPAPSTYPLLTIGSFNLGTLTLTAADQLTPDKKTKPPGAAGLLLFSTVAEEPASEPTDIDFNAFLTKPKFSNVFDPTDNNKYVTYFGRWTNGKGELGPWGPPVSIRIAA